MRLINTQTLSLEEYFGDRIPKYAILSHTWKDGEVSFQEWQHDRQCQVRKQGYQKILAACREAKGRSFKYLWVDTNCIDKGSSAELSEAINSMFNWYQRSDLCIVYLDDFHYDQNSDDLANFADSRWFSRGWTLQELLAPRNTDFFDASWTWIGNKWSLLHRLSAATSIKKQYLESPLDIRNASVSTRMSWAAKRQTTREEDMAYCLLGLFDINMPLLYGEGVKAFIRLQEEIIKYSTDHTIFCWSSPPSLRNTPLWDGCLAPMPSAFINGATFITLDSSLSDEVPPDYQMTNSGLRINIPLLHCMGTDKIKIVVLNAIRHQDKTSRVCLLVSRESISRHNILSREPQSQLLTVQDEWVKDSKMVYIRRVRQNHAVFSPASDVSSDS
ncbi:heterokaryon incompatibility protein-domain-containing protein [Bombardia bombarda]|uniref:Heterokaryon incompatibility protein-domain-containing protein n=1 Tax=Bombardia bombarda TaxID=252184 RepID=A0AA39XBR5_9PEZI|nr:heterokaryon incompatibility protein-domain-containing protein [Bombardia bombarda]